MLSWHWVIICWIQEGDVLYPVVFDTGWEVYLISIGGYQLGDSIWAKTTMVEFGTRSLGSDVAGIKPYLISKFECWCRLPLAICMFLVFVLDT